MTKLLEAGTREHYLDAALYEYEYRHRRQDVRFYVALADRMRGEVLELGCGSGRVLLPLLRAGHRTTGVDAAAPMLAHLRARLRTLAPAIAARATLHQGDFRTLRLRRKFPLVICPFSAFMHLYTDDDVERFLATVRTHLAPGGRFAFDLANPDLRWLADAPRYDRAPERIRHPETGEWMRWGMRYEYDVARQIVLTHVRYLGKRPRTVRLAHRYFFPRELQTLLRTGGFTIERHDGTFYGSPLGKRSESQVLVCRMK